LSKDRKVRAIIFSRNNLDITQSAVGRRNRQGASISYRKDFENLFSKPKPKQQEQPPAGTPVTSVQPFIIFKNDEKPKEQAPAQKTN
jgi:hypothetical protein